MVGQTPDLWVLRGLWEREGGAARPHLGVNRLLWLHPTSFHVAAMQHWHMRPLATRLRVQTGLLSQGWGRQ